jgi:hypothetical protein
MREGDMDRPPWFLADRLKADPTQPGSAVEGLRVLLRKAFGSRPSDQEVAPGLQAQLLVVVDGFHALFPRSDVHEESYEAALASLIDFCRSSRAIFLFTSGSEDTQVIRLEYLCDLVLSLDRVGFDDLNAQPIRVLRLLKARKQAVRPGAHLFHLTAPRGLRVKPSLAALADADRQLEWSRPDTRKAIFIRPTLLGLSGLDVHRRSSRQNQLEFKEFSQILVRGLGSSGKATLSLSILHRRPLFVRSDRRDSRSVFFRDRKLVEEPSDLRYESRILIVSFLYNAQYYSRILNKIYGRASFDEERSEEPLGERQPFLIVGDNVEEMNLPRTTADVLKQESIALYPGGLTPEDLLAKILRRLRSAELRGLPFTGVLIDGIHNVFLQFPRVECSPAFWPQLFSGLRRRSVMTVTTHTDFRIGRGGLDEEAMLFDAKAAQSKASPLLSVLVSAGDYVLDIVPGWLEGLSDVQIRPGSLYEVRIKESLDPTVDPSGRIMWDRSNARWLIAGR